MRYLNKVIFINSAHIPYAEIKLDGNVHFIGTQGVGKSTLLRAILFFYNVDKGKLGIRTQDKQKSYDEFYFPFPNSYIIYEVCRENGNFFVVTFLSNGRVAFRIVDCAYDKRFFVDENRDVRFEWGRISEQLGTKTFRSNIIRGYEEFIDILYGNVQSVAIELRRFNIMESSRYQNVPRTIQNIFLNQSLESRVIKDTIIDSMDFAGDGIDLNFYREHVKDFRQQYDDIWKWFKKEKSGKVKVRVDADNVIAKYALCERVRKAIDELCAMLNYGLQRDEEHLPQIELQVQAMEQDRARQERLLGEEDAKYHKERDELKAKEALASEFLRQVKAKALHYSEIGISHICEMMIKERELQTSKKSFIQQENLLTDKHQSVKTRYEALRLNLRNDMKECRLQAAQHINHIDGETTSKKDALQTRFVDRLNEMDLDCKQKMDQLQGDIDAANQDKAYLMVEEQRLRQTNPFEKEINEKAPLIAKLEKRRLSLTEEKAGKQQEITRITTQTEAERKEIERICEKDVLEMSHAKELIAQEVAKLQNLLSRQKGSMAEWLDDNVEGWKDNLGKVIDNDVLYCTSLNPCKVADSDTLYGIKIDLQHISKTVKTPEELKARLNELEQTLRQIDAKAVRRQEKCNEEIADLERKPAAKLKQLRLEMVNIDAELSQIPQSIDRYEKGIANHQRAGEDWRKQQAQSLLDKCGMVEEQLAKLRASKQAMALHFQHETDELKKWLSREKEALEKEAQEKKNVIADHLQQQEADAKSREAEMDAEMDAELKGLGVDVDRLQEIRKAAERIDDDLHFIEIHRADFYAWQNDQKDYFNLEEVKKEEKKQLIAKLQDLQAKYEQRREKKQDGLRRISHDLQERRSEVKVLAESIDKVRQFAHSTSCPVELGGATKKETVESLASLLDKLKDKVFDKQQNMEDFKRAVTVFKTNFSPQNVFHFRSEFNTENDYTEFAAELYDFISNGKIDEYRLRTSHQYAAIIQRIAREVGDLNQHNAEIKATINEINRDFKDNNFAGVIKHIELRAVESSDPLVQLLLTIKKFDEQHSFDLGSLNLFSTEEMIGKTNDQAVKLLMTLIEKMDAEKKRDKITLADSFKLEFKVKENDNDTSWVEKLSNVGSDGTDILVKSMVNIMLINVFKRKISKRFGDFRLHCMMDEIGKLHPENVEGILKFANVRNIYLINSSPTTYNAQVYKHTYLLSKDEQSNTIVKTLLSLR